MSGSETGHRVPIGSPGSQHRTNRDSAGAVLRDSPAVEAPEQVPDAATPAVLAWVGDDKNRAQQALDKEQQSENPRKGLTNELNEIING